MLTFPRTHVLTFCFFLVQAFTSCPDCKSVSIVFLQPWQYLMLHDLLLFPDLLDFIFYTLLVLLVLPSSLSFILNVSFMFVHFLLLKAGVLFSCHGLNEADKFDLIVVLVSWC